MMMPLEQIEILPDDWLLEGIALATSCSQASIAIQKRPAKPWHGGDWGKSLRGVIRASLELQSARSKFWIGRLVQ